MKRVWKIKLIAALFLGCLLGAQEAYADGECFSVKELKASFEKGAAAEKAGKLEEAFGYYGKASYETGCMGEKNPASGDAKKGFKRVGQRLGADAEKRGDFSNAAYYFGAIKDFANEDRVMMKKARAESEDLKAFMTVFRHFKERLWDKEYFKREHNYTVNPAYLKELEDMTLKNSNKALEKEDKAFTEQKINMSQEQLRDAIELFTFLKKTEKALERAEKRGDALYADDKDPELLREAIEYYEMARNGAISIKIDEKIKKVRAKADRLGDVYAKKGEAKTALKYYKISRNDKMASEMEKKIAEEKRIEREKKEEERKKAKEESKIAKEKKKEERKKEKEERKKAKEERRKKLLEEGIQVEMGEKGIKTE